MIEKGANNWEEGMAYASLGGHKDIVELTSHIKIKNEFNINCYYCYINNNRRK